MDVKHGPWRKLPLQGWKHSKYGYGEGWKRWSGWTRPMQNLANKILTLIVKVKWRKKREINWPHTKAWQLAIWFLYIFEGSLEVRFQEKELRELWCWITSRWNMINWKKRPWTERYGKVYHDRPALMQIIYDYLCIVKNIKKI